MDKKTKNACEPRKSNNVNRLVSVTHVDDKYYPTNTNTNFFVRLDNPIVVKEGLQVGLQGLSYKSVNDKNKQTVFTPGQKDNIMTHISDRVFNVVKQREQDEQLIRFITDLNFKIRTMAATQGIIENIEFQVTKVEEHNPVFRLSINNERRDAYIRISKNYANVFGFEKPEYGFGLHEAENNVNYTAFRQIDQSWGYLNIRIILRTETELEIEEPQTKDITHLLFNVNEKLEPYQMSIVYDGENIQFKTENDITTSYLRISRFLKELLGIDTEILYGNDVVLEAARDIDLGISSDMILILCDLIEPQEYQNKDLPILAILPYLTSAKIVTTSVDPILYLDVKPQREIKTFKISLVDEHLKPIKLNPEFNSMVTLHFKNI